MADKTEVSKEAAPKKDLKKYTVTTQFTGTELHRVGTSVRLDQDADSTKQLLTNKFIR